MASAQHFACEALDASFPLVRHLMDVADEWSAVRQRKGSQISPSRARNALCSFEGAPCALFASPAALLHRMRSNVSLREPIHLDTLGRNEAINAVMGAFGREPGWEVHNSTRELTGEQVLLLPRAASNSDASLEWLRQPLRQLSPTIVLVMADAEADEAAWGAADASGGRISSFVDAARAEGYGASFFPGPISDSRSEASIAAAAKKAAAAAGKSKRRRGALGGVVAREHSAAVLWRRSWNDRAGVHHECAKPLYQLDRAATATREEADAASAAVRAGMPFSEWFACSTLHPLAPLVRTLLTKPRRMGKSVWAACFEGRARAAPRVASPCFWLCGEHHRGEHFVEQARRDEIEHAHLARSLRRLSALSLAHPPQSHGALGVCFQVLSSPDVLLARLSSFFASARSLSPILGAAPPLLVLDPAAGEANYTQHLPDGMGRLPVLQLVDHYKWHAALAEPAPPTFQQLRANFAALGGGGYGGELPSGLQLQRKGLLADASSNASTAPSPQSVWVLEAAVPELGVEPLPAVARQRLQWASSVDHTVPKAFRRDYWQMDHLAGGPLRAALERVNSSAANAFGLCLQQHKRKSACFRTKLSEYSAELVPWSDLLASLGITDGQVVDLLVVDVRDASVDRLLRAFPFARIRPTLLYYRHPKDRGRASSSLRSFLMGLGYTTSAHWEVSAWGELNLAWRSDRCHDLKAGMPGRPLWYTERSPPPPAEALAARGRRGRGWRTKRVGA